jgi:N-dimethylarginine dimethylaminohydrolase
LPEIEGDQSPPTNHCAGEHLRINVAYESLGGDIVKVMTEPEQRSDSDNLMFVERELHVGVGGRTSCLASHAP